MTRLATIACLLLAAPASGQRIEVAPFTVAAFTTSAPLHPKAVGIDTLEVERGFTWGAQVAYLLSRHTSIEAQWSWQSTGLKIATPSASATLFYMDVRRLGGSIVYEFGEPARGVRPFVLGGAGVAFLTSNDLDTQAKTMFQFGGGVKWYLARHFGVRGDARYQPIRLGGSASALCTPFEFCQGALHPFQISSALIVRY